MSAKATSAASHEVPFSIKNILAPLAAIIVGIFMVVLDGTAVNVAIPGLLKEFNTTYQVVQWTVTGYALAQAAVIPLAGWLSDRFGAKQVFIISVILFTIGSLLCAFSSSVEMLIIFRILQGLGGGMVMPIAMAFTFRLSPPEKVGAVMGMMGIPILLAPALGPVLAGWLVDYASWKWLFLINIPIGIVGTILAIRTLPKVEKQAVAALDRFGFILAPIAFAGLSYGVSEGAVSWTASKTIIGITVGAAALILFIIAELRHKSPLLELRVFRSGGFTRGIIVQWISQIALFGTMFLVPLFLQQAKGYSAFDTGLIMLPQAIAAGVFMPIGGKLYDKIGARPLVLIGMLLVTAAAFILSTVDANSGLSTIMIPLALLGAGMGLSMMPLNTHLMQAAPRDLVSRVTSLTNAAQQVMTSFAVAGLATILAKRMVINNPTPEKPPTFEIWSMSFGDTFLVLTFIAVFGAILGLMLSKPARKAGEEETKQPEMMMHIG
ncbi:MFS transporter [Paenibacillus baekrokdamisoli]|uniref:MFS transporter n=1 Tax=Paenibacillus baekrokdamisoli TaxID=1712516 RepID=A0A3G9J5U7_9BACL|nr:DHA2 family efflux MFS transporter permease subunit [Paenibacillus baekrokdamisoli]MBB3069304.1 EmrB/QacA subfamily drug resistance transporter [Paenibacillus baekrokdamisoli]BBH18724.1 MFS transporter [Paenibacillus baekrokdamisoli]